MLCLLVEDDDDLSQALTDALAMENWTVHSASTVHDAAQLICQRDFDIIVTDVRLKVGSGMDVVSIARVAAYRPVIIIMTGNCDMMPEECYGLGAHGFLLKPFLIKELVMIALSLLNLRKGVG